MRMLLRPEFPNGVFGDPALYIWELNEKSAVLVDCGDLSRFTPKQLLKVDFIFLSHCHIDHFFGFDSFLRIHVGTEKKIKLFGPPQTSGRVGGKLQGYTWNLIRDQNLEFEVVDLDEKKKTKKTTRFHAKDEFRPTDIREEGWDTTAPILESGVFQVRCVTLDHRTPSLAYSIEEKKTIQVNSQAIEDLGLKTGAWIQKVKEFFLFSIRDGNQNVQKDGEIEISQKRFSLSFLSERILIPRQRHKIVYATDGAASEENRVKLIELARDADLFFSETCFLKKDEALADETKHFTAKFMGELASQAGVKEIAPFHFSKRYLSCPDEVFQEVRDAIKRPFSSETHVLDLRKTS